MPDQLTDLHQLIDRITDLVRHELATRPPRSRDQESNNETADPAAAENARTQQRLIELIDASGGAEYSVRVSPGGQTYSDPKTVQAG